MEFRRFISVLRGIVRLLEKPLFIVPLHFPSLLRLQSGPFQFESVHLKLVILVKISF